MTKDPRDRLYPGDDYPHLNTKANGVVRVEVGTPSTPSGKDTHVSLVVRDHASGEMLVSVELDAAEMWLLCQGRSQVWHAFIGTHLDRVGKRMENQRVNLPPALDGDTEADLRRDVWKAVQEQLPEDWRSDSAHGYQAYDEPRTDNTRQRFTIVRRWIAPERTP